MLRTGSGGLLLAPREGPQSAGAALRAAQGRARPPSWLYVDHGEVPSQRAGAILGTIMRNQQIPPGRFARFASPFKRFKASPAHTAIPAAPRARRSLAMILSLAEPHSAAGAAAG